MVHTSIVMSHDLHIIHQPMIRSEERAIVGNVCVYILHTLCMYIDFNYKIAIHTTAL